MVASFTDAWIETPKAVRMACPAESHLLQMRGLKPVTNKTIGIDKLSHLLQMRGLKPRIRGFVMRDQESHLLQMRGLKPYCFCCFKAIDRRIFYRCVD